MSPTRLVAYTLALVALLCPGHSFAARSIDVLYSVQLVPSERSARVRIRIGEGAGNVRWLRLRIDPERHADFQGNGQLQVEADTVTWHPPAAGGSLSYSFRIDHLRDERSYDARCTRRWAIFRGEDLVPPMRVRTRVNSRTRARLRLRLPEGWSAATPYPLLTGGDYGIEQAHRRFDRPTGWFALGELGVLREEIAGVRVAIAGPVGHSLRRMDMLALFRWTLPTLQNLLGRTPKRLLVVGAGDPMWRGGLSGPGSLYLHARLPLITEDVTSPLLHELVHSATRLRPGPDGDWVVEGLAELYSLELLRRSGAISDERHAKALERIGRQAKQAGPLRTASATGPTVDRAVVVLYELDRILREESGGAQSLDDVLRALIASGLEVTTESFRSMAEQVSGGDLADFFGRHAPERARPS